MGGGREAGLPPERVCAGAHTFLCGGGWIFVRPGGDFFVMAGRIFGWKRPRPLGEWRRT